MPLHFGIPSLDELIDSSKEERKEATTFALIGPDGTGKSVLALHLASRYHFDCMTAQAIGRNTNELVRPLIVYVSSDLQFSSANAVWKKFGLDEPGFRQIPFERTKDTLARYKRARELGGKLQDHAAAKLHPRVCSDHEKESAGRKLHLRQLLPLKGEGEGEVLPSEEPGPEPDAKRFEPGDINLLDFLNIERLIPEVGFLDLAGASAGDDWSYVNILLGKLSQRVPPTVEGQVWPHLVIIDSVAGFETFVGEFDAFGLKQSRRTRVAQCIRHAGEQCHLGFIVEETEEMDHQPEEYVTDVVIRVRRRMSGAAMIRTVEIEKARARTMSLGEHPFEILAKDGTSTGEWENPDHPRCKNNYVHVHHSLSHRNFHVASRTSEVRPQPKGLSAAFGIHYLDMLLPRSQQGPQPNERGPASYLKAPPFGLDAGSTTALIGDFGTGKSVLARRFLAEGFRRLVQLRVGVRVLWDRQLKSLPLPLDVAEEVSRTLAEPMSESSIRPTCSPREWTSICQSWEEDLKSSQLASDSHVVLSSECSAQVFNEMWPRSTRHLPRLRLRELLDRFYPAVSGGSATFKNVADQVDWRSLKQCSDPRALSQLFQLPHFQFPAVLLTTSDENAAKVAREFLSFLLPGLRSFTKSLGLASEDHTELLRSERPLLEKMIEEQIILRRFDISSNTSASLFHMIHQNVLNAYLHVYQLWFPEDPQRRFHRSDRIRLVVDDLSSLAAMCPEVATDTSFLPFLTFQLEREGITSLLVFNEAVRPDRRPDQGLASRLQTLLQRTIMLWPVPFEGQNRVAISVVPTGDKSRTGLVREFLTKPEEQEGPRFEYPVVTPRFELYSRVDQGKPTPVPLAIYLFSETPAFETYMQAEDRLFRELFVGTQRNGGKVLVPIDADQVAALREFSMLPLDTKYDHSTVFQVDAFWVMGGGALTNQAEYLFEKFDPEHRPYQDPFGLFTGDPVRDPHQNRRKKGGPDHENERIRYFTNKYYSPRLLGYPRDLPDDTTANRVPFMWDFGFLLLRHSAWESAFEEETGLKDSPFKKVSQVRDALRITKDEGDAEVVPWRAFLGACQAVARKTERETGAPTPFFEIAGPNPETLNCLILEMWMSELRMEVDTWKFPPGPEGEAEKQKLKIGLNFLSAPDYDPKKSNERLDLVALLKPRGKDLGGGKQGTNRTDFEAFQRDYQDKANGSDEQFCEFVSIGSLTLYKVWLLLLECIEMEPLFEDQESFQVRSNLEADRSAVASRHWYKTACAHSLELRQGKGNDSLPLPVRLPGNYSSRGDWFLASPSSSRSELLARYAMDLLCSRRANLTRMQLGLGLPTRDVLDEKATPNLRTALVCKQSDDHQGSLPELKYGDLCKLAARSVPDADDVTDRSAAHEYFWLWRSAINDYDRLARPFQKWVARMMRWSIQIRRSFSDSDWEGGFRAYDALSKKMLGPIKRGQNERPYASFVEFGDLCDLLHSELEAAQTRHDSHVS